MLEELIHRFQLEKNQSPLHANELLDYVQKRYIQSEISIVEYKNLFNELTKRNAEKPHSYIMNINQTHLQHITIPG
jgi:YppF-like protein